MAKRILKADLEARVAELEGVIEKARFEYKKLLDETKQLRARVAKAEHLYKTGRLRLVKKAA